MNSEKQSMFQSSFLRSEIRAPLKTLVFYTKGEKSFKGQVVNISYKGILVEKIEAKLIEEDKLYMLLDIPLYPKFENFTKKEIENFEIDDIERSIIRASVKVVRVSEGLKNNDIFKSNGIGCIFIHLGRDEEMLINDYINNSFHNISYLNKLLNSNVEVQVKQLIFKVAYLLNYNFDGNLGYLKELIERDTSNLSS